MIQLQFDDILEVSLLGFKNLLTECGVIIQKRIYACSLHLTLLITVLMW